jgi:hypothetical protein
LPEAQFQTADAARGIDPTLAAKYHRLMVQAGKHRNSALCHIATTLLTRVVVCWRAGQPHQARDNHGAPVSKVQAKAIIAASCTIPTDLRTRRRTTTATGTDRRNKKSHSAPSTGPSTCDAPTTRIPLPRPRLRHRPPDRTLHRIDVEELYRLLDRAVIDDAKIFNQQTPRVEGYYTTIASTAASTAKSLRTTAPENH